MMQPDLQHRIPTWHAVYVLCADERGWRFIWGGDVATRDAVMEANARRDGRRVKVYRDRRADELRVAPRRPTDLVYDTGVGEGGLEAEMKAERERARQAQRRARDRRSRGFAGRSLAPIDPLRR